MPLVAARNTGPTHFCINKDNHALQSYETLKENTKTSKHPIGKFEVLWRYIAILNLTTDAG